MESVSDGQPHQPDYSPEPDAGNTSMMDGQADRPNESEVSQGVLASATADELALVGMAK